MYFYSYKITINVNIYSLLFFILNLFIIFKNQTEIYYIYYYNTIKMIY